MTVSINATGTYSLITRPTGANGDATTGWSIVKLEGGGGTPSVGQSIGSTDLVVEGANAIETITNKQRILLLHTPGSSYDFTSDSSGSGTVKIPNGFFWIWVTFLASGSLLTKANGGMQLMLGDGTNRAFWNIEGSDTYLGGFKPKRAISVDLSTRFTTDDAGTPQIGNITEFGVVTDVGGATTRFQNFVVDAYDVGDGLTFTGATTSDKLFLEAFNAQDSTKIGILKNEDGNIGAQGNIEFDGTSQVSDGETLVFTDTVLDPNFTYACNFTGGHTLTNSSIGADGVSFNLDTSGATSFSMTGGQVYGGGTVTTGSGQTLDGVVFSGRGLSTIANVMNGATWNGCDQINITGQLVDNTINDSTNTGTIGDAASTGTDTNMVDGCKINKQAAAISHAFKLTGATKGSAYSWSAICTGYDAGTTGNGVQVTGASITGKEHIYIPATTGTFEISVADGATVPSVATGGATVNVTANQITIAVTVLDDDTGAAIGTTSRVYLVRSSDKSVLLSGAVNASGVISTQIDFDSDTAVEGWARDMDLSGDDYVPKEIGGTYTANGFSTTVRLKKV